MIAPLFTGFKQSKENKQWVYKRGAVRTSEPDSIQRMNLRISSGRKGGSVQFIVIYIIELYGVNNYMVSLKEYKIQYLVVWKN